MAERHEINLRKLTYSPNLNPLVEPTTVEIKRRYVQSGRSQDLVNPDTGEVHGMSVIRIVEEKDDAEFVKVFRDGVIAAYTLRGASAKVFQAVLDAYQRTKMTGGFADSVRLFWFDGGLDGHAIGMSESTFRRGLKELLKKRFLAPQSPDLYWVNPSLFFKGDRVKFVKEYVRAKAIADKKTNNTTVVAQLVGGES